MPEELTPRKLERAIRRALAADRAEQEMSPEQYIQRHYREAGERLKRAAEEKGEPLTHKEEQAIRNRPRRRRS